MNWQNSRKLAAAGAGLAMGLTTLPALAQNQPEGFTLEEVIVTARKRAENLQQVPLSITALTSVEIERRSIRNLADVAQNTPGVTFFDANPVLATPVIRGLSQTVISAPDRNVGLFYNGVFLSNMNASNFDMFDMERIEVVKGPVSALYGRNAFAGAINYVPKQASFDQWSGAVETTLGSQSRYGGRGSINMALSDAFAVRLSAGYDEWDGSWRNLYGGHAGGFENTAAAWDIRWKPTDRLSIGQFGFYVDDTRGAMPQLQSANNCGQVRGSGTSPENPPRPSFYCGELQEATSIAIPKKGFGSKRNGVVTGLNVDYDFGPVTASLIGGYVDLEQSYMVDLDLGTDVRGRPFYMYTAPRGPLDGLQPQGIEYFSTYAGTGPDSTRDKTAELRLASRQDQSLRWMLGASYYKHFVETSNGLGVDSSGYTGNLFPWSSYVFGFGAFRPITDISSLYFFRRIHEDGESPAGYLSLGYDVTDKLTLNADVRYDQEKRTLTNDVSHLVQKRTDKYWTYRGSVDYQLDADKMVYASVAKGVIAGFFNGAVDPFPPFAPVPLSLQNYKPSTNITYEIGTKATWLDRRLTTNLAVFYIDYTDLQITVTPPPPLLATLIGNAAGATAKGFELSIDGRISEQLTAGLGYGYTDPTYDSGSQDLGTVRFCGVGTPPLCTTDVSGNQLTRASKDTVNAYVEYESALAADWTWFARLDGRYQSKQYPRSLSLQWYPGYTIGNARVGFSKGNKFDVELWVKNLTDETYIANAIAQPLANPTPIQLTGGTDFFPNVMMGDRRTYGITARAKF